MRHDAVTSSSIRPRGSSANALESGLSSLKSQPAAIFQNPGYIDRAAGKMAIANVNSSERIRVAEAAASTPFCL